MKSGVFIFVFIVFYFSWQYWGLNLGPHACKASTLPLSYNPASICFLMENWKILNFFVYLPLPQRVGVGVWVFVCAHARTHTHTGGWGE